MAQSLIGLDDTDAPSAGCTTHAALVLAGALAAGGWRLAGPPALVRLNPTAPWKTRGNAAVRLVVEGDGSPGTLLSWCEEVVASVAERHPDTQPGIVVAPTPPAASNYWDTVRRLVPQALTGERLAELDLPHAGLHGGRGLTGALAAVSWPGPPASWEHIAWRRPERRGVPRPDLSDVAARLDTADGSVFDSWDPRKRVARITPRGHDPVLWGIRGTDPGRLATLPRDHAALLSREEPLDSWVWATNQASDDHLVGDAAPEPNCGRRLPVAITGEPESRPGGHVLVPAKWRSDGAEGEVTLAAFEPTKTLARAARLLAPGDGLEASGSFGADPRTMNLEKFRMLAAGWRRAPGANPRCGACGRAMRSEGRAGGYRCRRCGARAPASARSWTTRTGPAEGSAFEASVCARRHLARPLVLGRDGAHGAESGPALKA